MGRGGAKGSVADCKVAAHSPSVASAARELMDCAEHSQRTTISDPERESQAEVIQRKAGLSSQ